MIPAQCCRYHDVLCCCTRAGYKSETNLSVSPLTTTGPQMSDGAYCYLHSHDTSFMSKTYNGHCSLELMSSNFRNTSFGKVVDQKMLYFQNIVTPNPIKKTDFVMTFVEIYNANFCIPVILICKQ